MFSALAVFLLVSVSGFLLYRRRRLDRLLPPSPPGEFLIGEVTLPCHVLLSDKGWIGHARMIPTSYTWHWYTDLKKRYGVCALACVYLSQGSYLMILRRCRTLDGFRRVMVLGHPTLLLLFRPRANWITLFQADRSSSLIHMRLSVKRL